MPHRHELSDAQWRRIAPLLPPLETGGTYYKDHRLILNGIRFRLQTGCPWRDLPERYGPWSTVASRFRRWTREGLWDRLLEVLRRDLDAAGALDWDLWCIDGTHVRAHRVAAGAGEKPGRAASAGEPDDHALGRRRGGFSMKIHLVTDGGGLPLGACQSTREIESGTELMTRVAPGTPPVSERFRRRGGRALAAAGAWRGRTASA